MQAKFVMPINDANPGDYSDHVYPMYMQRTKNRLMCEITLLIVKFNRSINYIPGVVDNPISYRTEVDLSLTEKLITPIPTVFALS